MATVPAGTKLGRYEVLKQLAKGGMADLLLARTSGLEGFERHVVIKRICEEQAKNAKFVEMFVTEARLAGALHHHNIVQVQDIGEENGRHYFAMEYVHGEDLRRLLYTLYERSERLPIEHLVTIVATVAAALHHAHEQRGPDRKPLGIVHRDVTPANILVGYDGNVKVLDFGIAKAAASAIQTERGVLKGKVPYMAPEQCTGKPVDRRSDVFSLGIVAYELATTRRLFKGETEYLTMSAIVSGKVPRPSRLRADLPPKLESIILKALANAPSDRYQTAEQMRAALEDYASKVALRMSASSLSAYMRKLFGERPEPWLVKDDFAATEVTVDFDGALTGVAPPPDEAVDTFSIPKSIAATKSSPIAQAFTRSINGTPTTTVRPVKQIAGLKTILPKRKKVPPAMPLEEPTVKRPIPASVIAAASFSGETTDVDVPLSTKVASPPPLPKVIVAGAPSEKESTAIVPPLKLDAKGDPMRATSTQKTHIGNRRWIIAGAVAVAVAAAAGVVLYLYVRSGDSPREQPAEPAVEATTPKPQPKPEPPKTPSDDIPFEQRTANNTPAPAPAPEPTAAEPAKPEPRVEVKAVEQVAKPGAKVEAKIEPAKPAEPKKPEPAPAANAEPKHVTAVAKPAAKPATKPAKPATKPKQPATPQWDPDALFLKKK